MLSKTSTVWVADLKPTTVKVNETTPLSTLMLYIPSTFADTPFVVPLIKTETKGIGWPSVSVIFPLTSNC
ncbi:hypothetical protein D3C85_995980 [compost metagenome]